MPSGEAVGSAGSGSKEIALTFDDGPSGYTGQVLDILDRHEAKATFFIVGRNAEHNVALIRRTVESGHEIGNHTWSHASLTGLPKSARHDEVQGANDSSAAPSDTAAAVPPALRRDAPGHEPRGAPGGVLPVVWSVDTRDYDPGVTAKKLIARVGGAAAGLDHPAPRRRRHRRKTVAALPKILDEIERRGYRAVTVTQLLNDAPPEQTTWRAGCDSGVAVITAASAATTAGSRLRPALACSCCRARSGSSAAW